MSFYFPIILTLLVFASGAIFLIDILFFKKHRSPGDKLPFFIDNARSFFWVLLVVWVIRSFICQPFVVPTGSLKPTVQPGDFLLVNQYQYGLHMPIWHTLIMPVSHPKRGDIMVFHWPVNPRADLIKRVLGLPGDRISYVDKVFYINGKRMPQKLLGHTRDSDSVTGPSWPVNIYQENLAGRMHNILRNPKIPAKNFFNLVVPPGEYLMVGDNRDNSDDGRDWGFVPAKDIVGKAMWIIFSWSAKSHSVRWHRIGTRL